MYLSRNPFILLLVLLTNTLSSQLLLIEVGVEHSVSFETSLNGVNEEKFLGLGLRSDPLTGELDSDAWIILGCSDGDTQLADQNTSGDFARGQSSGAENSGGLYAFDTGNNTCLGWQSTSSDLSPGEIILKIQNKSNFSIERLELSYTIWLFNDQNRSQNLSTYYSYDNSTYYPIANSDYSSETAASLSPLWKDSLFSFTLETNEIQNNDYFYLKWRIEDEAGSGSRDEWGLDDIKVKISNNICLFEAWSSVDSTSTLISSEGFTLFGVDSYYDSPANFGSHSPSARMDDDLDRITSPILSNVFSMKFWIKALGNPAGSSLFVEGFDGGSWLLIDEITPLPTSGSIYNYQNLNAYSQFRFSYSKVNGNLAIDDISISCGSCDLASTSPNLSGSITFPFIYCNEAEVTWSGNSAEYYLVLATEKEAISFLPQNHHSYLANSSLGEGEMVGDSVFVVYNGSENEFSLNQLKSDTEYLIKIISYNGLSCEENYSNSSISQELITPNCAQCPYLLSALINACNNGCTNQEGYNELLFFNSGAYQFSADTSNFKIHFGSDSYSFLNENLLSNPSLVNALNSLSDCPTLFIDALSISEIPAGSAVLLCHSSLCLADLDKSYTCQYPVVYVLVSDSDDWNPNGEFNNTGYIEQSFNLDFRDVSSNCMLNYSYTPNDLAQEDGTIIFFSAEGGDFTHSVVNENCSNNLNILPLTWGDITISQEEKILILNWQTLSEWNNEGFAVERSINGGEFKEIAFVKSKGDSEIATTYRFNDIITQSGNYIFRIKQIDLDGSFSYSSMIGLEVDIDLSVYQIENHLIIDGLEEENTMVELYTLQNECVLKRKVDEKRVRVDITNFSTGIYLIRIVLKNRIEVRKVYLNVY